MEKRLFGIMTLLVGIVLAFTLLGCKDVLGEGTSQSIGWPPKNVLNKYGLSTMTKPPGSNFWYLEARDGDNWVLTIEFTPATNTTSALTTWFNNNWVGTNNTWTSITAIATLYPEAGRLIVTTGYL